MGRVRVYIACSLDGFIAGPDGDLSWLPGADSEAIGEIGESDPDAIQYDDFMADVGALLMGRATYDAVVGFGGPWPYAPPVLVATSRALEPAAETVRAVSGDIEAIVDEAKKAAGEKDVYLDGGAMIRSALDAGLIDEVILTEVPIILGEGHPLFAGAKERRALEFVAQHRLGNMLQVVARPV